MDPNDQILTAFVVWILAATIVAWIGHSQGRGAITWFVLSVVLSPLIGFVAVILTAPKKPT